MQKLLVAMLLSVPCSLVVAQELPAGHPAMPPSTPATTQAAVAPDAVVVEIDGQKITAAEFDRFLDALPDGIQAQARGPMKRMVAEQFVQIKVLSQAAEKAGLDKTPEFATQLALARDQMLAQKYVESMAKNFDDTELKAKYEKNKADYDLVTARHILIRTSESGQPPAPGKANLSTEDAKKKADDLRKQIVEGKKDFAAVAKSDSDDPGSGAQGGNLGAFTHDRMVPEFADAAFKLKIGEVSQPVKSKFGWHLIQVQDRRPQTYDEVKEAAVASQDPKKIQDQVEKIKKDAKVTLNDAYFGPARPAMQGMPAGHP